MDDGSNVAVKVWVGTGVIVGTETLGGPPAQPVINQNKAIKKTPDKPNTSQRIDLANFPASRDLILPPISSHLTRHYASIPVSQHDDFRQNAHCDLLWGFGVQLEAYRGAHAGQLTLRYPRFQ